MKLQVQQLKVRCDFVFWDCTQVLFGLLHLLSDIHLLGLTQPVVTAALTNTETNLAVNSSGWLSAKGHCTATMHCLSLTASYWKVTCWYYSLSLAVEIMLKLKLWNCGHYSVPPNGIENCLLALQIFALACHVVAVVIDRYVPTWFWGKSGHIQTILYGKMGRVDSPMPRGCRCAKLLADGATITYDIFQPLGNLKTGQLILFQLSALVIFFQLVDLCE